MIAFNAVFERLATQQVIQTLTCALIHCLGQGLGIALMISPVLLSAPASPADGNVQRYETEFGEVEISIGLEKPTTMLREPTSLVFTINNLSDRKLFTNNQHSRNRYGRPVSFQVFAKGDKAQQVELLKLDMQFGGMIGWSEIPPGESWSRKLFLPNWFLLSAPGDYTITCETQVTIGTSGEAVVNAFGKSDPAEIEDATLVDVDLSTALTVVPEDNTKMGQLIDSLGQAILAKRYDDQAQYAMKQLLAINDSRVVPYLVDAVSKPDYSIRYQAIRGLAKFDSDEAIAGIEIGLATTDDDIRGSSSSNIRHAAAQAFAQSPHPKAEARLLSLLDDPEYAIRLTALHRLGKLKSKVSLELLKLKTKDLNDSVRREAIRYIKKRLNGDSTSNAKPTAAYVEFLRALIQDYQVAYDQARIRQDVNWADARAFCGHWLFMTQADLALAENRLAAEVQHLQAAVDRADFQHKRKKKFYDTHHPKSSSSEHTHPVHEAHTRMLFAQGRLGVAKQRLEKQKRHNSK